MLQPKRTKFRKAHKGRNRGMAKGGFTLNFGSHGLKALEPERARIIDRYPRVPRRVSGYNLDEFITQCRSWFTPPENRHSAHDQPQQSSKQQEVAHVDEQF